MKDDIEALGELLNPQPLPTSECSEDVSVYTLGALSFGDARPRDSSEIDYDEKDVDTERTRWI